MLLKNFHNILDKELNEKIEYLKKLYPSTTEMHKRGYAFLLWCLELYKDNNNFIELIEYDITEGNGDASCDIIFEKTNYNGQQVFYIIQGKSSPNTDGTTDEILKAIADFDSILQGNPRETNAKTKKRLAELREHQRKNGEIKFFFICACEYKGTADQNINTFNNRHKKAKFKVIDINQLRLDYIEAKFKNSNPETPFETYENPEKSAITLDIEASAGLVTVEKPYKSHVFLVRPQTIWQLFNKYKFALFHQNVRNPLLASTFNQEIEKTAIENPALFWYYNNGITGITQVLDDVGTNSGVINGVGLQIINGAQTVYSIYRAYEQANDVEREIMNSKIHVSFRLLESGGNDFNLKVTRYTNSQNPVMDRDFFANDEVQNRLQKESFQTNFWYEKRRGEFKEKETPAGVKVVSNEQFADAYLAYHLQEPSKAFKNSAMLGKKLNFISHKDSPDGSYEKIFNEQTQFEDMLASYLVYKIAQQYGARIKEENFQLSHMLQLSNTIALMKIVLGKYFSTKYKTPISTNQHAKETIQLCEKLGEKEIIIKAMFFVKQFVIKQNQLLSTEIENFGYKLVFEPHIYQQLRDKLENQTITAQEIENIELPEELKEKE